MSTSLPLQTKHLPGLKSFTRVWLGQVASLLASAMGLMQVASVFVSAMGLMQVASVHTSAMGLMQVAFITLLCRRGP